MYSRVPDRVPEKVPGLAVGPKILAFLQEFPMYIYIYIKGSVMERCLKVLRSKKSLWLLAKVPAVEKTNKQSSNIPKMLLNSCKESCHGNVHEVLEFRSGTVPVVEKRLKIFIFLKELLWSKYVWGSLVPPRVPVFLRSFLSWFADYLKKKRLL